MLASDILALVPVSLACFGLLVVCGGAPAPRPEAREHPPDRA